MHTAKYLLFLGIFAVAACGQANNGQQVLSSNEKSATGSKAEQISRVPLIDYKEHNLPTFWIDRNNESALSGIALSAISATYAHREAGPVEMNGPPEEVCLQALYENESNDGKRLDAVTTLSLYREDSVIDVLIRTASDPRPEIRYRTLETLRYAAADGLNRDGRITAALEYACSDSNQAVAMLARSALSELKQERTDRHEGISGSGFEN